MSGIVLRQDPQIQAHGSELAPESFVQGDVVEAVDVVPPGQSAEVWAEHVVVAYLGQGPAGGAEGPNGCSIAVGKDGAHQLGGQ